MTPILHLLCLHEQEDLQYTLFEKELGHLQFIELEDQENNLMDPNLLLQIVAPIVVSSVEDSWHCCR